MEVESSLLIASYSAEEAGRLQLQDGELDSTLGSSAKISRHVSHLLGAAGVLSAVALVLREPLRLALPGWHGGPSSAHVADGGVAAFQDWAPYCSVGRQNCNTTKCCSSPGMLCYEQDGFYAQCREDCQSGPDPTHWDGKPWSCRKLGVRKPGKVQCSNPGEDCRSSKCCQGSGLQCYEKDENYASCKVECSPGGPDLSDADGKPWSCTALGPRTPTAAPWVAEKCAKSWDNCLSSQCCQAVGQICYKQNDYFGACRVVGSCPASEWNCSTVGWPTPAVPMKFDKLSSWVTEQCSKPNEGCMDSRCCLGMDMQCYEKGSFWAQCRRSCVPGLHADDKNESWSCKPLGPRSYGLAIKGFPSLFCFSVVRTNTYEGGLVEAQHQRGAGIFACDHFSILTADFDISIDNVHTIKFAGAPIVQSVDNTAGNTELFVHAWKQVVAEGQWRDYAFTVKADPDAVFIPHRLRWSLASQVFQKMFVVNCPMWNMIYGALEVFSFAAIEEWSHRGHSCAAPANFGEDKYMTQCMDFLGVMRVKDDNVLGDQLCHTFTSCDNPMNAAFHPFKDIDRWLECWKQAENKDKGVR